MVASAERLSNLLKVTQKKVTEPGLEASRSVQRVYSLNQCISDSKKKKKVEDERQQVFNTKLNTKQLD